MPVPSGGSSSLASGFARLRFAAWEEQRQTWKLANKGDNRYAAEKRLYKFQLKEMRRHLLKQDLLKRREEYLQQKMQQEKTENDPVLLAAKAARAQRSLESKQRQAEFRREQKKRLQTQREEQQKNYTLFREAQVKHKSELIKALLEQHDIEGSQLSPGILAEDEKSRVSWITPENIDLRLPDTGATLLPRKSPVDRWVDKARRDDIAHHSDTVDAQVGMYSPRGVERGPAGNLKVLLRDDNATDFERRPRRGPLAKARDDFMSNASSEEVSRLAQIKEAFRKSLDKGGSKKE